MIFNKLFFVFVLWLLFSFVDILKFKNRLTEQYVGCRATMFFFHFFFLILINVVVLICHFKCKELCFSDSYVFYIGVVVIVLVFVSKFMLTNWMTEWLSKTLWLADWFEPVVALMPELRFVYITWRKLCMHNITIQGTFSDRKHNKTTK